MRMHCTVLILLFLVIGSYTFSLPAPIDAVIRATYMQTGTKKTVDDYGKCLEKKYIKKEQEKYWAMLAFVIDSVTHNEIKFRMTF